jgi:nucleoside-diphosphate-sugar epimerase
LLGEKYKIKNFIFTSTFSIYEKNYNKPILENETPSAKNSYGKSKYKVETILKRSKLKNYTILRVPIVVGKSRSHRMGILYEMIRNNFPLFLIGDGNNKIQFIQVDDLCLIIKKCLGLKRSNTFNVGTKKSFTFKENLSYILEKSKSKSKALLTKNIVLNTKKIFNTFKLGSDKSSKDILLENYNYYVKNLKNINNIKSGSDKKPNLKIFNILKIFSRFF